MNLPTDPQQSRLELEVGRVADEFEALCRLGQPPKIEEFVGRYPHLADVLREILPAVQVMQASSVKNPDTEKPSSSVLSSPNSFSPGTDSFIAGSAYEILGELGRGGMGIVYKARQVALDRVVALKMIRAGMAASPDEQQRLQREAQTAAQLCHPNIVQIYEVGDCAGQPYLSLEYLDGGSLDAKLKSEPQPPRHAAALVETLARAIDAAHRLGLVHRDLKPANILLAADGTPKIADFGLVKRLTDDSLQTQGGAIVGTPSYMAPEQASGQSKNIGPAADIYALGAILYDVLTGRPPFKAATTHETLEQVRLHEPVSPVKLQPGCPRDLETICLKCLAKEPARRYASAADLADDLQRFLKNEPIQARPIGVVERTGKWVRRRPTAAALLAVSALAIILPVVLGGVSYWQITDALAITTKSESDVKFALGKLETQEAKTKDALARERNAGEAARNALIEKQKALEREELTRKDLHNGLVREKFLRRQDRQVAYLGKIGLAQRALEVNDLAQADHYLHECPLELRQWEWRHLKGERYAEVFTIHNENVYSLDYSPDGRRIAMAVGDQGKSTIKIWDAATGKEDFNLRCAGLVPNVAFSANGKWLAASVNMGRNPGWLKVWNAQDGTEIHSRSLKKPLTIRVRFSADSRRLITESNVEIQHIDTATWKTDTQFFLLPATDGRAAFLPDGNTFAFATRERGADGKNQMTVKLHTLGKKTQVFPAQNFHLHALALSQDGKYLAAGDINGSILIWDLASGREIHSLFGHAGSILTLAFSPDNKFLVSGSNDKTANVWHVQTGQLAFTIRGHAAHVGIVAFRPDGQHLATVSADGTVRIWNLAPKALVDVAGSNREDGELTTLAFHPKGHLAMATRAGSIIVRQAITLKEIRLEGPKADWQQLAYSRDEQILAAAGATTKEGQVGIVQTWDGEGKAQIAFRGHEVEDRTRRGRRLMVCVALGAQENLAASATRDEFGSAPYTVKIWDRVTGAERFTYRGHEGSVVAVAFSPDGTRVASAEWSFQTQTGRVKVWDAKDGKDRFALQGFFGQQADSLAFSPDGTILAACSGHNVMLWDGLTGLPLRTLSAHSAQILGVEFTADSQRLLTVGQDRTAKLWDLFTGREALTLRLGAEQAFIQARFSPDQQQLAAVTSQGERRFVKLWSAPSVPDPIVLEGDGGWLRHLSFSPDGRWLFAGSKNVRAWNLDTNREEFRLPEALHSLAHDPEGGRCAAVHFENRSYCVKILDLSTRLEVLTLSQAQGQIRSLAYSPDGRRLAVAQFDDLRRTSLIKIYDLHTGLELVSCAGHTGAISTMAFNDDGKRLISVSRSKEKGELKTWNTGTGTEVQSHALTATDPFGQADLSPDRRYLATNSGVTLKGEIKLWDVASGAHLGTIPLPKYASSLAFSPDGKHLATGVDVMKDSRSNGVAQIWEVPSCKEVLSIIDPGQPIGRVAFHPQGRWLATGQNQVKIWDLKVRQP